MSTFLACYYLLWGLSLGLTLYAIDLENRRANIFMLFWAALLLVFVFPSVLDPFDSAALATIWADPIDLRQNPVILKAQAFYLGFTALYLAVRLSFVEPKDAQINLFGHAPAEYGRFSTELILAALLLAIAAVLIFAAVGFSLSSLAQQTYSSFRLESETPVKMVGQYLAKALAATALLLWLVGRRSMAIACVATVFFVFLAGRTRQFLLPLVIPFGLYLIAHLHGRRFFAAITIGGAVMSAFFIFWKAFRYAGSLENGFELLLNFEMLNTYLDLMSDVDSAGGETRLRIPFYYFLQPGIDFPGFQEGLTFQRLALLWLPSFADMGIKPEDFDQTLFTEYARHFRTDLNASIHILFMGSAYTNFGWFGMALGAAMAFAAKGTNEWLKDMRPAMAVMLTGPISFALLMMARGSLYNTTVSLVASTIIVYGVFQLGALLRSSVRTST